MNPVIRTRWAKALRSGDYDQTNHALKDSKGYCCLGVLCDLYAQDHDGEWEPCTKHGGNLRVVGTTTSSFLPQEVADWAMLSEKEVSHEGTNENEYDVKFPVPAQYKHPDVGIPDHSFIASSINDNFMDSEDEEGEGSFKEIADLVDAMSSTYKESQRGYLARPDVEDEDTFACVGPSRSADIAMKMIKDLATANNPSEHAEIIAKAKADVKDAEEDNHVC
jgi:hypothetical protein